MESPRLAEVVFAVIREKTPAYDGSLRPDTPLGADGLGLDSIALLDVVLELERRTGIPLRDENLTAEVLATPDSLIRHLEHSASD